MDRLLRNLPFRRALWLTLLCVSASTSGYAYPAASKPAGGAEACGALNGFKHETTTRITAAEWVRASAVNPWRSPAGFRNHAFVKVPFCRVAGVIMPTAESQIRFEVWLPAKSDWNGRFFGTASGGSMGAIQYPALVMPLERGFAAMGHDNGHVSQNTYEQNWAFDAQTREVLREKLMDFGYRAQHVATVVSKAVAADFYGKEAHRSYFVACSQGGHHGLMEAQRFPDDYDGIVAGGHGGSWTGMVASQAWAAYHAHRNDRAGALSKQLAAAVARRAVAHCDAYDGVSDGQIEDPRRCDFDPGVMQCGTDTADPDACLSAAQVAAMRAIYRGPRAADGRQLAHGFMPGSEVPWWPWTDDFNVVAGSFYDFYRLLVHKDPDWDFLSMDWERDIEKGRRQLGPIYDATDPDLSEFMAEGGKLIMYHGWADPLIPPQLSVDMWESIVGRMGEDTTREFARLFMIPAMGHCSDGPIGGTRDTQDADWLTAIQNWVEKGIPPDADTPAGTVIGVGIHEGRLRRRPYCPYPKVAKHVGTGSFNYAANFYCDLP